MNFAILGTGYVADQYPVTLANHPALRFVGAWDHNTANLDAFLRRWPTRRYESFDALLADPSVDLILNLTNPRSHFETTSRCLDAGKHVYSEKPLAMTTAEAHILAARAAKKKLLLASAPCSALSETARTLVKAVRDGVAGAVRLAYANFEDGMIAPRHQPWNWRCGTGVPWPAKDEFEIGCTYEHAGYVLAWLIALFGPVRKITSFAGCQIPDKGIPVDGMAPDFTSACLLFDHNVVARVTCGLVAPKDKSITVIGDEGTLFIGNVRNDTGPVFFRPAKLTRLQSAITRRLAPLQRWLEARLNWPGTETFFQKRLSLISPPPGQLFSAAKPVDFLRGPAEMAAALDERRPCRLTSDLAVHLVEIVERLQHPERFDQTQPLLTSATLLLGD